jgi:hypothetical protein
MGFHIFSRICSWPNVNKGNIAITSQIKDIAQIILKQIANNKIANNDIAHTLLVEHLLPFLIHFEHFDS